MSIREKWRVSFAVLVATATLLAGCGGGGGGGGDGETPYVISGATTLNGAALGYVSMNLDHSNSIGLGKNADSSGHYSFSALQNGSYSNYS